MYAFTAVGHQRTTARVCRLWNCLKKNLLNEKQLLTFSALFINNMDSFIHLFLLQAAEEELEQGKDQDNFRTCYNISAVETKQKLRRSKRRLTSEPTRLLTCGSSALEVKSGETSHQCQHPNTKSGQTWDFWEAVCLCHQIQTWRGSRD